MPEDDQFLSRREAASRAGVPSGPCGCGSERAGCTRSAARDDRHTRYSATELDEAVRRASEPALDWDALQDPLEFAPGGSHLEDLGPIEIEEAAPEAGAPPRPPLAAWPGEGRGLAWKGIPSPGRPDP